MSSHDSCEKSYIVESFCGVLSLEWSDCVDDIEEEGTLVKHVCGCNLYEPLMSFLIAFVTGNETHPKNSLRLERTKKNQ